VAVDRDLRPAARWDVKVIRGAGTIPVLIALNADGQERARLVGLHPPNQTLAFLKKALG
jgi:hypothetical protein